MSDTRTIFRQAEDMLRQFNRAEWHILRRRMWRGGRLRPGLAVPRVTDEKYLWRKLVDHDRRFIIASDKLACKAWVAARWPDVPLPRTLWVGRRAEDLPAELCRPGVVLKLNAGSGSNLVLGPRAERAKLVERLGLWLRWDHGWQRSEWAYQPTRRRVFAEERVFRGRPVSEIKVYVQAGFADQVVMKYMDSGRLTAAVWEDAGAGLTLAARPAAVSPIRDTRVLPPVVGQALEIARRIGSEFDHMRVDFLTDLDSLMLGELTVCNMSGRLPGLGHRPQARINRHWDLRRSWFLNHRHLGWRDDYAQALKARLDELAKGDPLIAEVPPIDPSVFDVCYDDFAPD